MDRLSLRERQAFEEELKTDQELARQVQLQQKIMGGLAVIGREQFKARLQRIKAEVSTGAPVQAVPRPSLPRWIWWVIGLIALALLVFMLWKRATPVEEPAAIYADLFEVYEAPMVQRDSSYQELIEELNVHYREGAYQAFIADFTPAEDQLSIYPELMLSLGISYLQVGQSRQAEEALLQVENGNYPAFHDHARWYRILAALQAEDVARVKALLPALLEDETADHHEAAKVLARRL